MPTELNAQPTLQIESDLILSAVLTGLLAQLAKAGTIIIKVPSKVSTKVTNLDGARAQTLRVARRLFLYSNPGLVLGQDLTSPDGCSINHWESNPGPLL